MWLKSVFIKELTQRSCCYGENVLCVTKTQEGPPQRTVVCSTQAFQPRGLSLLPRKGSKLTSGLWTPLVHDDIPVATPSGPVQSSQASWWNLTCYTCRLLLHRQPHGCSGLPPLLPTGKATLPFLSCVSPLPGDATQCGGFESLSIQSDSTFCLQPRPLPSIPSPGSQLPLVGG